MSWKATLSLLFIIFVSVLFIFYWFLPFQEIEFSSSQKNNNFTIGNMSKLQFYPNMRFPTNEINYSIEEKCPLQKRNNVQRAFRILTNETILSFSQVNNGGQINVECDDNVEINDRAFVAGEGGPTKIIPSGSFNLILEGKILMLKLTECEKPNVALHEILHVLGFEHSDNPRNIMYEFSRCNQVIGEDIPQIIGELYSVPSLPDLAIESSSAYVSGRYLDSEIKIVNQGLFISEKSELFIFANDKEIYTYPLEPLEPGYGIKINLDNIRVPINSPKDITFLINSSSEELDKINNRLILEIKNKN